MGTKSLFERATPVCPAQAPTRPTHRVPGGPDGSGRLGGISVTIGPMATWNVEIRGGEGGDDADLFAKQLTGALGR